MALKKLNQFNYFDAEGFFSKLKLITVGSTVWKEYGSNVVKGTKLEVVIASDKHRYNSNEGEVVNNMYLNYYLLLLRDIDHRYTVAIVIVSRFGMRYILRVYFRQRISMLELLVEKTREKTLLNSFLDELQNMYIIIRSGMSIKLMSLQEISILILMI